MLIDIKYNSCNMNHLLNNFHRNLCCFVCRKYFFIKNVTDLILYFQNFQTGVPSSEPFVPHLHIVYEKATKRLTLHLRLDKEGCFNAVATYGGVKLKNGEFTVLVLNG